MEPQDEFAAKPSAYATFEAGLWEAAIYALRKERELPYEHEQQTRTLYHLEPSGHLRLFGSNRVLQQQFLFNIRDDGRVGRTKSGYIWLDVPQEG